MVIGAAPLPHHRSQERFEGRPAEALRRSQPGPPAPAIRPIDQPHARQGGRTQRRPQSVPATDTPPVVPSGTARQVVTRIRGAGRRPDRISVAAVSKSDCGERSDHRNGERPRHKASSQPGTRTPHPAPGVGHDAADPSPPTPSLPPAPKALLPRVRPSRVTDHTDHYDTPQHH